jgi:FlaG/FlaF family flagellin (archaellin)
MYFAQLELRDSLKALWILLILAALAFGILAVSRPSTTQAIGPKLTLQFTCAQAVDYQADSGTVCVHTQAGAALTITVRYCSGYPAVSSSLQGTVYADASGNSTWTWTPETVCRGPAVAHVTATLSKHRASKSDTFTVQ